MIITLHVWLVNPEKQNVYERSYMYAFMVTLYLYPEKHK